MEVKINREIREYTEAMFFGLSMRQFVCSVLALAASVGAYFALKPLMGTEVVSWLCVIAAVPFGVLGFVRYNGMSAEKFIAAWIKSELLMPKRLAFGNTNMYWSLLMEDQPAGRKNKTRRKKRD